MFSTPMKAHRQPTRRSSAPGLTTTAGAIVALVAIAATMAATPSTRPAIIESRTTLADTKTVRAVAAAMVAVARELAGKDRVDSALPAEFILDSDYAPIIAATTFINHRTPQPRQRLSERQLDLPPPGC